MNFDRIQRGEVVDRQDPKELGRVRVKIEQDGDVPDKAIPWAVPITTFAGIGNTGEFGSFSVPKEKSKVWVFFEGGDRHKPVYIGNVVAGNHIPKRFLGEADQAKEDIDSQAGSSEPSAEMGNYGESHGFVLPDGSVFEIDENGRLVIYTSSGYRLEVLSDGTRVEHIEGEAVEFYASDKTETVEGDKTEEASQINVKSDKWNLDAGGSTIKASSSGIQLDGGGATIKLQGGVVFIN